MTCCYIQLGRYGDILNLLPLLHKDSLAGVKPKLMVAAEYAPLLDGVSYVEPVIYPGPHYEIIKAVEYAKSKGWEPVVCQVNGPIDAVKEHTYGAAGQQGAFPHHFFPEAKCTESWAANLNGMNYCRW